MTHKHLVLTILIAFITISSTTLYYRIVRKVYDGDTILVNGGERIRYLGINAPETGHQGVDGEFMALESKDYNAQVVDRKRVRLEFDREKRDQ